MDFEARLQMMTLQIVPFFGAIIFHEFAHGWVAKLWGDRTAADSGRLTLNPLSHIDPVGTVLIPVINMITGFPLFFGWAKPVPINPTRFRKYRQGLFTVSLAGPGMNIVLAFVCAIGFAAFLRFVPENFSLYKPLALMLQYSISINFMLAAFNLLPIPPLDGAKIIESFVGYNGSRMLAEIERYSFFILLGLLWFNVFSFLQGPVVAASHFAMGVGMSVVGISL